MTFAKTIPYILKGKIALREDSIFHSRVYAFICFEGGMLLFYDDDHTPEEARKTIARYRSRFDRKTGKIFTSICMSAYLKGDEWRIMEDA